MEKNKMKNLKNMKIFYIILGSILFMTGIYINFLIGKALKNYDSASTITLLVIQSFLLVIGYTMVSENYKSITED